MVIGVVVAVVVVVVVVVAVVVVRAHLDDAVPVAVAGEGGGEGGECCPVEEGSAPVRSRGIEEGVEEGDDDGGELDEEGGAPRARVPQPKDLHRRAEEQVPTKLGSREHRTARTVRDV